MSNNTGCLGMLLGIFQPNPPAKPPKVDFPYAVRDNFLSPAELKFYKILKSCTPNESTLISKVRLSDIFYVRQPNKNRGAINRIHMKHVDFLICANDDMKPLLGIELDDKSHNKKDRKNRDIFVDSVFSAAGLPLLHVQAAGMYNQAELQEQIRSHVAKNLV